LGDCDLCAGVLLSAISVRDARLADRDDTALRVRRAGVLFDGRVRDGAGEESRTAGAEPGANAVGTGEEARSGRAVAAAGVEQSCGDSDGRPPWDGARREPRGRPSVRDSG